MYYLFRPFVQGIVKNAEGSPALGIDQHWWSEQIIYLFSSISMARSDSNESEPNTVL